MAARIDEETDVAQSITKVGVDAVHAIAYGRVAFVGCDGGVVVPAVATEEIVDNAPIGVDRAGAALTAAGIAKDP